MSDQVRIWTPKNMRVDKVSSNRIHLLNNDEFRYLGVNLKGQVVSDLLGATLSCTCTAGSGGCSPGQSGDTQACIFGEKCTACSGSVQGLLADNEPGQFQTARLRSGGFIKKQIEVHFATVRELQEQAYFFAAMTKLPEIREAVKEFASKHSGKDASARSLVSVAGRILIVVVDREVAESNQAIILAAKGSCSCTDGTCVYKKIIGVGEGCDATNCKGTCTLTTGVKVDGKILEYQTNQF